MTTMKKYLLTLEAPGLGVMNLGSSKAFNVDGGVGDPPLDESELLQLAFLSLLLSFRYSRALKRSLK